MDLLKQIEGRLKRVARGSFDVVLGEIVEGETCVYWDSDTAKVLDNLVGESWPAELLERGAIAIGPLVDNEESHVYSEDLGPKLIMFLVSTYSEEKLRACSQHVLSLCHKDHKVKRITLCGSTFRCKSREMYDSKLGLVWKGLGGIQTGGMQMPVQLGLKHCRWPCLISPSGLLLIPTSSESRMALGVDTITGDRSTEHLVCAVADIMDVGMGTPHASTIRSLGTVGNVLAEAYLERVGTLHGNIKNARMCSVIFLDRLANGVGCTSFHDSTVDRIRDAWIHAKALDEHSTASNDPFPVHLAEEARQTIHPVRAIAGKKLQNGLLGLRREVLNYSLSASLHYPMPKSTRKVTEEELASYHDLLKNQKDTDGLFLRHLISMSQIAMALYACEEKMQLRCAMLVNMAYNQPDAMYQTVYDAVVDFLSEDPQLCKVFLPKFLAFIASISNDSYLLDCVEKQIETGLAETIPECLKRSSSVFLYAQNYGFDMNALITACNARNFQQVHHLLHEHSSGLSGMMGSLMNSATGTYTDRSAVHLLVMSGIISASECASFWDERANSNTLIVALEGLA
eukprot:Clim_evm46s119 gene=Clim_evmTU46s119